jgi:hypothetical protein
MPKAKPISLNPLTFEQVIDVLIRAAPAQKAIKKKRATAKPKKKL